MEKKGMLTTKEAAWGYYVQKCRNNLHVVLAMSPVGETLRTRCRNFPGMVSASQALSAGMTCTVHASITWC